MAGHEAIFKVSMRSFARFVDDFEQRRRHGSTVFHVHILESGFADIWPPESEHEGWLQAYDLPGERSLVVCEVHSPAAWPDIEPHWQELLSEARRLGALESDAAPEPVAQKPKRSGGSVPEPLEERARCVFEWEKARASQPGLSGAAFVASRADVYTTGGSLYRWRSDPEVQAYIERHYRSSAITQP